MSFLDKIVTPTFITWNAHMWFAAFVVSTALWYVPATITVSAALALAALKEFYIDKHFETGQTFLDNLRDFAGYASGVAVGWYSQHVVLDHVVDQVLLIAQSILAVCKQIT
jgi:hypothetical protein